MMDYLITNLAISVSLLLAVLLLKSAPARVSFYLLMLALCSWFMPWQLMPGLFPGKMQLESFIGVDTIRVQTALLPLPTAETALQSGAAEPDWLMHLSWDWLATAALIPGVLLFLYRVWNYRSMLRQLQQDAIDEPHLSSLSQPYPVKVTRLNTAAIATGIFKPTIWLNPQLLSRPELRSVLLHENTHLQQGDLRWLWLICLTESLFWWNPVCALLARKARQMQELSCDERCFALLQQQYQFDLASLLLKPLSGPAPQSWSVGPMLAMVNSPDFNMQRVKMLNKEKVMKIQHLLTMMTAVSISTFAAAHISQQQTPAAATVEATASAARPEFSLNYKIQKESLLKAAARAKSKDAAELKQVVANIDAWRHNRMPLGAREEQMLKLNAFTLLAHVQHKLGQYQEIITAFESWYPDGTAVPYFLRNITANSYLKLNNPDLALKELTILQRETNNNLKPGSLYMLALLHTQKADYAQALKTLAQPGMAQNTGTDLLKYYIYSQQNDLVQLEQIKTRLPKEIAGKPALLPDAGFPGSPLLAQLPAA
ncbi:M56 family metallopeptidase [Rheinheimera sp. 4Y26]|uniref:M56 family metallopeptidase n=1 Tax=Rheinheimera sp. 4Y26 TaxID=2977811 RepID=UPI0021B0BA8B|nr:M56 family metallopeptidase [Rheinheimera sp. 4Y26]MCT6700007.1 hypothetical protein [Rheinheimera sp. 4Y26]